VNSGEPDSSRECTQKIYPFLAVFSGTPEPFSGGLWCSRHYNFFQPLLKKNYRKG
jgi:hypothetical protein